MRRAAAILTLAVGCAGTAPGGDVCPPDPRGDVRIEIERLPGAPMDASRVEVRGMAQIAQVSGGYELEVDVLRARLIARDLDLRGPLLTEIEDGGLAVGVHHVLRIFGVDGAVRLIAWDQSEREVPRGTPTPLLYVADGCELPVDCYEATSASLTSTRTGARIPAGSEGVVESLRVVNGASAFRTGGAECRDRPGAVARGLVEAP